MKIGMNRIKMNRVIQRFILKARVRKMVWATWIWIPEPQKHFLANYRGWVVLFLVCVAGSMGTQSFANPTDAKSLSTYVSQDVLKNSILSFLNLKELMNVSQTSQLMKAFSAGTINKLLARKKITQLIGNLKKIEKGSAVIGPNPGEPDPFNNNQAPEHAEITEDYWVEERVVDTQEQYRLTMGDETFKSVMRAVSVPESWKKPDKAMPGLTDSQQRAFYAKRNETLRELWPIAYTAEEARALNLPEHVPQAYLPNKKEYMYAGTEPLNDAIVAAEGDRYSKENGKYYTMLNGQRVEVTARALTYSGTNDPTHAREYVDMEGDYDLGPLPAGQVKNGDGTIVDAKFNARGLKGLVGGIGKAIDEPYDATGLTFLRLDVGGYWNDSSQGARLASCFYHTAEASSRSVGRWPVYR